MDAVRHANRIALVTGAGSGIGRATVLRLVQEGAAVIACDINSDGLDGTRRALDELGMSAELDIADVTQQGDVDRLVAAAGPRIDILANVAGIMDQPLAIGEAQADVSFWLSRRNVVMIEPTSRHLEILAGLLEPIGVGGNLVQDAHLAALAVEHGGEVHSADGDFARFSGVRYRNPLTS